MNRKSPLMRVAPEFVDLIKQYEKDMEQTQGVAPSKIKITKHIASLFQEKRSEVVKKRRIDLI